MATSYSLPLREAQDPNLSDNFSSAWSNEYVSGDPHDDIEAPSPEKLVQVEAQGEDPKGGKTRILVRPQVTVNVFNTGVSGTGGSRGTGNGSAATMGGGQTPSGDDRISNLANQLADLTKEVQRLSLLSLERRPIIETGTWNTKNVRPLEPCCEHTEGRIDFSSQFKSAPTVAVSISSADVANKTNFRVRTFATDIDKTGFTIHADSWSDTHMYSCGVSWIAIGE